MISRPFSCKDWLWLASYTSSGVLSVSLAGCTPHSFVLGRTSSATGSGQLLPALRVSSNIQQSILKCRGNVVPAFGSALSYFDARWAVAELKGNTWLYMHQNRRHLKNCSSTQGLFHRAGAPLRSPGSHVCVLLTEVEVSYRMPFQRQSCTHQSQPISRTLFADCFNSLSKYIPYSMEEDLPTWEGGWTTRSLLRGSAKCRIDLYLLGQIQGLKNRKKLFLCPFVVHALSNASRQ